jgi:hypothetical protein
VSVISGFKDYKIKYILPRPVTQLRTFIEKVNLIYDDEKQVRPIQDDKIQISIMLN